MIYARRFMIYARIFMIYARMFMIYARMIMIYVCMLMIYERMFMIYASTFMFYERMFTIYARLFMIYQRMFMMCCVFLYTTCARMLIVRSYVPLRQPEDGQYRPKHVVVHYIVIKYTSCDTIVFDCIQFPSFTHTTGMTHFLDAI